MSKLLKNVSIYHLIILSFFLRLISYYFFRDIELVNEWGKIIHNKETTGVFGFYIATGEFTVNQKLAEIGDRVLPTIFMPPLYYYFIYALKSLSSEVLNLINLIIFIQILLSLISIFIFFKILKKFASEKLSIIFTLIFAFFPIYVIAPVQISSITLQIFLLLNFLYFLIEFHLKKKIIYLFFFSLFSGLLILIRGEFFLFYFFTLFYFFIFFERNIKIPIISFFVTILLISPYIYRNYVLFENLTLTKSFGYNLLKGNNPSLIVEGDALFIETNYPREKLKIKTNTKFEIELDNFYKNEAVEIIKEDPKKYIKFYFKKVISFLFFDTNSSYPNYYNFFHIAPKFILSITTFVGALVGLRFKGFQQFFSLYYFTNILLFSLFFILPRYSLILLPIQLLISLNLVKFLFRKL